MKAKPCLRYAARIARAELQNQNVRQQLAHGNGQGTAALVRNGDLDVSLPSYRPKKPHRWRTRLGIRTLDITHASRKAHSGQGLASGPLRGKSPGQVHVALGAARRLRELAVGEGVTFARQGPDVRN